MTYCLRECTFNQYVYIHVYKPQTFFHGLIETLGMKRTKMTETQTQILMERFKAEAYPKKEDKCQLAQSLSTTKKKIERWFKYMRSKKVAEGVLNQSE